MKLASAAAKLAMTFVLMAGILVAGKFSGLSILTVKNRSTTPEAVDVTLGLLRYHFEMKPDGYAIRPFFFQSEGGVGVAVACPPAAPVSTDGDYVTAGWNLLVRVEVGRCSIHRKDLDFI